MNRNLPLTVWPKLALHTHFSGAEFTSIIAIELRPYFIKVIKCARDTSKD